MAEKNERIWIISEIYYPVKTSTGYYITEIAEYLSLKGMDVHVICTGSNYNKGETGANLKNEIQKGVKIHRVHSINADKDQFLKRIIRLIYASVSLLLGLLPRVQKGDKVMVVTNPAFLILLMPYVKWKNKIKYWILVHDVFPENISAIRKNSSNCFLYYIIKKIFDSAYSKAHGYISIGRDMSNILECKVVANKNISFIPLWAENDIVRPQKKQDTHLSNELQLNNKFIFQFAGNLGHAQGLDNIMKAISLIKNENIHFLFIGGGAKYNTIQNFAENHRNVSLLGFQDRSNQNDFLNACDVAIVTLSDGMYGLGVPSKSYNIMAAGKPILMIGHSESEIALCIKEYDLGWIVEPNNPEKLRETFEEIYNHQEQLQMIGIKARTVADNVFAKKIILEKYYQLFT